MIYENYKRTLEAADILGIADDALLETIRSQIERLEPVLIGDDGQIKEYREETTYSSIGDPHHRHVSHLVGLYPGTIITDSNEERMRGAKITLTGRGDESTGWAAAHRLLLWARTKTPNKAFDLIRSLMSNNIMENLWDTHPPFQIDGNFGYTAGVCEMLLASHTDCIELLPALPAEWADGEFSGLVARGNFSIDAKWQSGKLTYIRVKSNVGGKLRLKLLGTQFEKNVNTKIGVFEKLTTAGEEIIFE